MFQVKEITGEDHAPYVGDIALYARESDEAYIAKVYDTTLEEGVRASLAGSDRSFAVMDADLCVAVTGITYGVDRAYMWVQTSSMTDGKNIRVIRAARQIINVMTEEFPFPIGVCYRQDDERVALLADACRFIGHTVIEHFNGSAIPHQIAWRY